ncbi:PRC-barrel domain-containing protein [Vallicoccus soli]|uniref:PRC-barrel domain containing protein n=1 Tax=Vallicoccus soli TaxID=2339232 RepID=A0A3A3YV15_9ACTN|nr:PRC-barrel domain-containing protein [Vallicoccus soli]RJK95381.1 PRC-barrel domain containing protein [Vallicoccus soli]
MFEAEDVRDWLGHDVVDAEGAKVGSLESVYYDTATQEPAFASVKVGVVSKKLVFVPLAGALVAPGHLKVMADKKLVKEAPSIDTDGELTADLEPAVFEHYGLAYVPGATGERRLGRR